MARVNHKLVKQRLNEERSKITDRQFFTSRILAGHFEDIAAAQTRRYNYRRRVRVNLEWKPKENYVASTNNMSITMNCGHPFVTKIRGRENRYNVVCGMFAHELGHILYTDFLANQTHQNYIAAYKWYPYPPDMKTTAEIRNEKSFWNYTKASSENLKWVQYIASHIENILEDGYIENRMLNDFPGTLGYGLSETRRVHYENMSTVTQLIEREDSGEIHIFETIMQLMLSYAKFGEIKYGDEPLSDERINTVFALISDIDSALLTRSGKERLSVVNIIMVKCWEYIESFLECCKERQKEMMDAGGSGDESDVLSAILGALAGSSEIAEGTTAPVKEESDEDIKMATAGKRDETHSDAGDGSGKDSDDTAASVSGNAEGESEKQETSENEGGRIPYHQTDRVSEPLGGTISRDDEYDNEVYDKAASDIERVLDKMAEKAACEELENERIRELNDTAQNISYGDIHSGVNIKIKRIASVKEEMVEQYNMIAEPLLNISRQLQKSLIQQLKENRRGGVQTNLLMGRRLNARAICRNDGKVFMKNSLPNEVPELAVGLLLDESGSMGCADRCTYARASAIILYDFCQKLGIPIMVYGHSTNRDYGDEGVELYSYAEFDSFDNDDKYRLMDIDARRNNRDGAALRFTAEQLSKRPEEVKLLIIVSDGQPAASGYSGTASEEDLRGIKQEYQKKGILFVAAAIGDDKVNIERIYGDSFLDITDLNQLPTKLTAVVKRHIRV